MQTLRNKAYVRRDEHGVLRIGETQVMLDSITAAFHQGHSPETIAQQYPSLSLEEVYGGIAYYLSNKNEVDEYLRRQDAVWKEWRDKAEATPNPVVQRLRSHAVKTATDVA